MYVGDILAERLMRWIFMDFCSCNFQLLSDTANYLLFHSPRLLFKSQFSFSWWIWKITGVVMLLPPQLGWTHKGHSKCKCWNFWLRCQIPKIKNQLIWQNPSSLIWMLDDVLCITITIRKTKKVRILIHEIH